MPTVLALLVSAHVALADEPTGPEDIVLPYEQTSDQFWEADRQMLNRYVEESSSIIVARVVATRPDSDAFGESEIATLFIEAQYRGDMVGLTEVRVPLIRSDSREQSSLIEGYRLLLFLDGSNNIVEGDAVFFIEGGYAWRNRRSDVFVRPSADRTWDNEINPSADYVSLSLAEVQEATETRRQRVRWWRRK